MAALNKFEELEKLGELLSKGILTQEEFEQRKAKILSQELNPHLEKVPQQKTISTKSSKPFSEQIAPLIKWISQNMKLVVIGVSSLLLLLVVYTFFIKSSPESDGQKAAKAECNCKTESNEAFIAAYQEFLKGYEGFGIKTREDAQKKMQEIVEKYTKEVASCEEKARSKYNSLKEKYVLEYEAKSKFENAYSAQQGVCTVEKETEKNQLLADIEKKVGGSVQLSQDEIIAQIKERYTIIFNGKYKKEEFDNSDPQTGMAGVCIAYYYTNGNGEIVRIDMIDGNTTEEQYYFWDNKLFFVFTKWDIMAVENDGYEHRYYVHQGQFVTCKEKSGNGVSVVTDCGKVEENEVSKIRVLERAEELKNIYSSKSYNKLCN